MLPSSVKRNAIDIARESDIMRRWAAEHQQLRPVSYCSKFYNADAFR